MTNENEECGPPGDADPDDYDLLTYFEAGSRLAREIDTTRRMLAEAESVGDRDGSVGARDRLAQLEEAQRRNSPRDRDDKAFFDFFGYLPRHQTH